MNLFRNINGEDLFLLSCLYVPFGTLYAYLIIQALLTM